MIDHLKARVGFYAALAMFLLCLGLLAWQAVDLRNVQRDRDAHLGFARNVCAAVGFGYDRDLKTEAPLKVRGEVCIAKVREVVGQLAAYAAAGAQAVQDQQTETAEKSVADRSAARRDDARAAKARAKLEKLDAAIEGDRVGGPWLRALGELGGLRSEGAADPAADAPRPEADAAPAAGGPPDLRRAGGELRGYRLDGDPVGDAVEAGLNLRGDGPEQRAARPPDELERAG